MDPINEIELEDCPVCRGAGYIEDEQGWCMYACCLNCGTETAHVSYKTPEERLDLLAERYQLTAREREIVALMQEGRSNPEIGEALYVTRNTVKKHIQNIYEKLGVNSRKGLEELLEEQDHPPG